MLSQLKTSLFFVYWRIILIFAANSGDAERWCSYANYKPSNYIEGNREQFKCTEELPQYCFFLQS